MRNVSPATKAVINELPEVLARYGEVRTYISASSNSMTDCAETRAIDSFISRCVPVMEEMRAKIREGINKGRDSSSHISLMNGFKARVELLRSLMGVVSKFRSDKPLPPFSQPWSDIEELKQEKKLLLALVESTNSWLLMNLNGR